MLGVYAVRKTKTYAICIIDVWADLAGLPLLRGSLWIDHTVRRHEPIARAHGFTIVVGDIEFQGPHFRELGGSG